MIFSVIVILLSLGVVYGIRYYIIKQSFNDVENSTAITEQNIIDIMHEGDSLTDSDLLSEAVANSQIEVVISDENGNIINASDISGLSVTSDINITRRIDVGDARLVVRNTQVISDGQLIAYIQVTKNLEAEYSFIKITIITLGIADIFGILLSVLAGFLVSRKMLKPIDKITKTAKQISISDLNTQIDVKDNDDELSHLAKTFNEMIERLRCSFEKQSAFVSDASHELRTPISVIRGYIDLIYRWGKNDNKVLDESITAIQNETYYMGDLVERLLFLAKSDTGRLSLNKERFNLKDLIDETINEYAIIHPQQKITSEVRSYIFINGDAKLIKQALRALIDNGIKFSPKFGEINVSASVSSDNIMISVKDEGIGIPKDKVDHIFERFYRADSARESKLGTGLGLSIVQTIIKSHGGRIEVKCAVGKGTTVSILIPADLKQQVKS